MAAVRLHGRYTSPISGRRSGLARQPHTGFPGGVPRSVSRWSSSGAAPCSSACRPSRPAWTRCPAQPARRTDPSARQPARTSCPAGRHSTIDHLTAEAQHRPAQAGMQLPAHRHQCSPRNAGPPRHMNPAWLASALAGSAATPARIRAATRTSPPGRRRCPGARQSQSSSLDPSPAPPAGAAHPPPVAGGLCWSTAPTCQSNPGWQLPISFMGKLA